LRRLLQNSHLSRSRRLLVPGPISLEQYGDLMIARLLELDVREGQGATLVREQASHAPRLRGFAINNQPGVDLRYWVCIRIGNPNRDARRLTRYDRLALTTDR
jgi:hypothetical protein